MKYLAVLLILLTSCESMLLSELAPDPLKDIEKNVPKISLDSSQDDTTDSSNQSGTSNASDKPLISLHDLKQSLDNLTAKFEGHSTAKAASDTTTKSATEPDDHIKLSTGLSAESDAQNTSSSEDLDKTLKLTADSSEKLISELPVSPQLKDNSYDPKKPSSLELTLTTEALSKSSKQIDDSSKSILSSSKQITEPELAKNLQTEVSQIQDEQKEIDKLTSTLQTKLIPDLQNNEALISKQQKSIDELKSSERQTLRWLIIACLFGASFGIAIAVQFKGALGPLIAMSCTFAALLYTSYRWILGEKWILEIIAVSCLALISLWALLLKLKKEKANHQHAIHPIQMQSTNQHPMPVQTVQQVAPVPQPVPQVVPPVMNHPVATQQGHPMQQPIVMPQTNQQPITPQNLQTVPVQAQYPQQVVPQQTQQQPFNQSQPFQ